MDNFEITIPHQDKELERLKERQWREKEREEKERKEEREPSKT